MISDIEKKYKVGPLLYTPAINGKIADAVINEQFGKQYSLAFCLEDTIPENHVEEAEIKMFYSLKSISVMRRNRDFFLPQIFIRVRNPQQLETIHKEAADYRDILSGYIFPKYNCSNAQAYNDLIRRFNDNTENFIYMMPIIESPDIIDFHTRQERLVNIKNRIDEVKDYVLNIRVGGNDFSNAFSVRRHYDETIYDILPVANLLGDILTCFSREYVVSGPVWEYFSSENDKWKTGLERELQLDRLNGFVGKTVIHPRQIPVVLNSLKVPRKDYEDAKTICRWKSQDLLQVGKSYAGERMNEVPTHLNWANKTLLLAEIYGVQET